MVVSLNKPGIASLKHMAFWALAIVLCAVPLWAQKGGPPSGGTGGGGGSRGPAGGSPPARAGGQTCQPGIQPQPGVGVFMPTMEPIPKPMVVEDEMCLPWDLPDMRGATVSAIRLGG